MARTVIRQYLVSGEGSSRARAPAFKCTRRQECLPLCLRVFAREVSCDAAARLHCTIFGLSAFLLFPSVFGTLSGHAAGAEEAEWSTVKSRHFLVHHRNDAEFAETVSGKAEECYARISADLGFTKHSDFWLWERRVSIRIYPTRQAFIREVGAPEWAAGKADYRGRRIESFRDSATLLGSVLPHEMAHLILADFMGLHNDIPLWLNEGVAQWEEEKKRPEIDGYVKQLFRRQALLSIDRLTSMTPEDLRDSDDTTAFYAQSAGLVGYMIREHGSKCFRALCGRLRAGKSVDDALRFTYPQTIRSMKELEAQWRRYLEEER